MEEKKGADTLSGLRDQFQYDGALYFNTAGRSAIPRCVEEEGIKGILFFFLFFFFFSFFFLWRGCWVKDSWKLSFFLCFFLS